MARKAALLVAVALVLTCAPTALPRSPSEVPSATREPIATTDLITLREGGQQAGLVTRKVSTGEKVRALADGSLLPDGVTILALEPNGGSTIVKRIDRRTGNVSAARQIDGAWQFYLAGMASFRGWSPDATHIV